MFGSIRLGSVLGISVRAHFLLLLLIGVFVVSNVGNEIATAIVLSLWCGLVLLHELGHCLVARHFGIEVVDITLWPLGGMARMSQIPESSKIEGLVAIAGPLVNLALVLLALPVWWALDADSRSAIEIVKYFVYINLAMGLFNLIPLFPTDGGRILRAWLARDGDWVSATESAVGVGRFFSLTLGVTGLIGIPDLLPPGNYLLTLMAIYLWWVGAQELMLVRMRHAKGPFRIFADFARRARAAERAAAARASSSRADADGAHVDTNAAWSAAATAPADRAPRADQGPHEAPVIDDQEIERLERFRGPLRSYRREPEG